MTKDEIVEYNQKYAEEAAQVAEQIRVVMLEGAYEQERKRNRSLIWYSFVATALLAIETLWAAFHHA